MDESFVEIFVSESRDELSKITELLLGLEKKELGIDAIDELMRLFHTLKGNSRLLSLNDFSEAAHSLEDVVKLIAESKLKLNKDTVSFMLRWVDELKAYINALQLQKKHKLNNKELSQSISSLLQGKKHSTKAEKIEISPESYELKVKLEDFKKLIREVSILHARLNAMYKNISIGLETAFKWQMESILNSLLRLKSELLDYSLYPISLLFSRFERMVRDLANEERKQINLIIEKEDVKLDKAVIDVLHHPLVHILRNAIDHGIELPNERLAAGKPPKGTIKIVAKKQRSGILIEITDDGRGIDEQKILKKALEMGVISKQEAISMSKSDIIKLIFQTGLSTKEKTTQLSGRGIGMDIVWKNITSIGGNVKIETSKGNGTKVSLLVPITLSLIDGIVVKVANERFVIPLLRVIKVDTYKSHLAKKQYPLAQLLGLRLINPGAALFYEYKNEQIVIGVDDVIGTKTVLLEKNAPQLNNIPGISGATMLSDGSVSLVIELDPLIAEVS